MNNRFLFRGKRVDNGEWVVGYHVGPMGCTGEQYSKHYIYYASGPRKEVDPATIGQCTCLLAAESYRGSSEQDRLVFEGDVFWDDDCEGEFTVVWDSSSGAWAAEYERGRIQWLSDILSDNTDIISTIHDTLQTEE